MKNRSAGNYMSDLTVNLHVDKEGFLLNLEDWTQELALHIAREEGIELNAAHWEVIHLLRQFYQDFERSPNMRALISYIKKSLDVESQKEKANSIYLLRLFPGSPAKVASKIAGLPKPENCL